MRLSIFLLYGAIAGSRDVCDAFTSTITPMAVPPVGYANVCLGENNVVGRNVVSLASTSTGVVDTIAAEELSKMTVVQLKDKLRELNLTVGGRKNELIERLNDHYLNHSPVYSDSPNTQKEDDSQDSLGVTEDEPQPTMTEAEALQSLTVPVLKQRLKDLGLPVGGRKAELIQRLQDAMGDTGDNGNSDSANSSNDYVQTISEESDDTASSSTANNVEDSVLLDLLDDILYDIDDEEEESPVNDSTIISHDNENAESFPNESESTRRARRKKYWKTQEVRDLIRSDDPRAIPKAEEMIATLEKIAQEEENQDYLPGPVQYTLLIDAYAKSGTAEGIERAEDVIDRILESHEQSNENNGGTSSSSAAVVTPSAQMFNAIIAAYANIGTTEAAERATSILERMEYMKEFGGLVKPSVHSYSITISAWAKCESETAAVNAENILNRLFEDYDEVLQSEDQGNYARELKPNNIVFNSVIDAWARSGSPDAGEKAEALLRRMEVLSRMDEYDVRPDTISFNTCIKAFCNSKKEDAPYKAEEVLSKLETNPQYPKRNGGVLTVRPNRLSYNTVINAWSKSTLPESAMRAEDLLLRMIKSFKSDTFATITPDCVTFASVLNVLAKSRNVRFKAEKCSSILKAMIDLHEDDGSYDTKPNVICYNTVLNACAFSARGSDEERRQAMKVAVETFNGMRQGKYVSPDAVSYGNMLKCCANLMPPGEQRNGMASRIFRKCCEEGLVGGMCLDEIRRCVPPRAFLPLLADCGYDKPMSQRRKAYSVTLRELPRKWTANVKRGDMAARQRGTFVKPKKRQQQRRPLPEKKAVPVIRRPHQVFEYGASGKDM